MTAAVDPRTALAMDLFTAFSPRSHGSPKWLDQELTFAQVHILILLGREGPLAMGKLAERLGVSVASATGIVARIERHGMLVRGHRTDDRRVVECLLTDAGRSLLEEMQDRRMDVATKALSVLDDPELAEFHRLVRVVLERNNR